MRTQLILLHGALGTSKTLEPLNQALGPDVDTYSFDFTGHGSTSSQFFDLQLLADQLESFITDQQLDQPHIFGYSMGGYVALLLAQSKPELIGDIICLGTKFQWTEEFANKAISGIQADKILEKVPRFAEYLKSLHGQEQWKDMLNHTADMMKGLPKATPLTTANAVSITNKTFLCLGDMEDSVSEEETTAYQAAIPNATFHILPETPHAIQKIDATALANSIKVFLGIE